MVPGADIHVNATSAFPGQMTGLVNLYRDALFSSQRNCRRESSLTAPRRDAGEQTDRWQAASRCASSTTLYGLISQSSPITLCFNNAASRRILTRQNTERYITFDDNVSVNFDIHSTMKGAAEIKNAGSRSNITPITQFLPPVRPSGKIRSRRESCRRLFRFRPFR